MSFHMERYFGTKTQSGSSRVGIVLKTHATWIQEFSLPVPKRGLQECVPRECPHNQAAALTCAWKAKPKTAGRIFSEQGP